jgi:hypothetical protein
VSFRSTHLVLGGVAAAQAKGIEQATAGVAILLALEIVGDAEERAVALQNCVIFEFVV